MRPVSICPDLGFRLTGDQSQTSTRMPSRDCNEFRLVAWKPDADLEGSDMPTVPRSGQSLIKVDVALVFIVMSVLAGASASAQSACIPPAPGMIHWWPGDGHSNDIMGSANGTVINGAGYGTGKVGMAFFTDGINDYVDLGSPATMNFGTDGDFSIEAWVNPEDFIPVDGSGTSIIMEKHHFGDFNAAFVLSLSETGAVSVGLRDTQNDLIGVTSPQPIAAGEYSHVAVTADRDGVMSVYVNGEMVASVGMDTIDDITNQVEATVAGPRAENSHGFHNAMNGMVDEVGIFDRELCPHEVKAVFEAGAEGRCKTPGTAIYSSGFECGDLRVWEALPGN